MSLAPSSSVSIDAAGNDRPLGTRVRAGIGWLALAQLAQRLSGLVVTAVLTRLLLPREIGLMAVVSMVTQLLGMVTELGLTSALIQRRELSERDIATAFWLNVGAATIAGGVAVALASGVARLFHNPQIASLLAVCAFALPIAACGQVPAALLQRRMQFRRIALIDWMSAIISGCVGIALAAAGAGVWSLVAQFMTAAVTTTLLRQTAVHWKPSLTIDLRAGRAMMTYGGSVMGMMLVNYACINVDNALIGRRLGVAALGYYTLAFNLALLPATNIGGLVTRVMFPALSAVQRDIATVRRAYAQMLRGIAATTFPLILGLGAIARLAVPLVYGTRWAATARILEILTFVGVLQAANVYGVIYEALGKPHYLLAAALCSLGIMTFGFWIGVRWGVYGVAWSYCIVSPFVFIPPHIIANRMIGLRQRQFAESLVPPLVAALIMALCVLALLNVVAATIHPAVLLVGVVVAGGGIYVASLYVALRIFGQPANPLAWVLNSTGGLTSQPAPG